MSDRIATRRRLLAVLALVVVAGLTASFAAWRLGRTSALSSANVIAHPLPPYSENLYLNTGPDAQYVGVDVCGKCHPENLRSYLHTAHSRAFRDLDVRAEPPDGSFEHSPTGRSYRVYRQGNEFHHEEILRTSDGKEIVRVDRPIRYLVGSGNFTRSYVVDVGGFLYQSPITWYSSRKRWGLSPGYDATPFGSFERPVKAACLVCHVGRAEPVDGAVHRLNIAEKAIGCENCHGPGARHVAAHSAGERDNGETDWTIVNPRRLSRSRQEAVCAVCHLNGPAKIYLRGRGLNDFRPGMLLTDYRIDYGFDQDNENMTVVGHVDQLRRSSCYQKSKNMTCLTCHDPHLPEKPKDETAFYRQKCLGCHQEQSCRLNPEQRRKNDATDNCMRCHMPRGNTEIPHVAFTHHRIGRHPAVPAVPTDRLLKIVPIEDVSGLPDIDRRRNLGLAYLEVSRTSQAGSKQHAGAYLVRARDLLEGVHKEGLGDGETLKALAGIYDEFGDHARAGLLAQEAMQADDLSAEDRGVVLLMLANGYIRDRRFDEAIEVLWKLGRIRRYPNDLRLLAQCHLQQGQPGKAVGALEQAIAIRPFSHELYDSLAEAYVRLRNTERSSECRQKARWLEERFRR